MERHSVSRQLEANDRGWGRTPFVSAFLAFEGFLGAGAAVQGAVLRGGGGGFGLGALFADAAEVDDLGHAAILA